MADYNLMSRPTDQMSYAPPPQVNVPMPPQQAYAPSIATPPPSYGNDVEFSPVVGAGGIPYPEPSKPEQFSFLKMLGLALAGGAAGWNGDTSWGLRYQQMQMDRKRQDEEARFKQWQLQRQLAEDASQARLRDATTNLYERQVKQLDSNSMEAPTELPNNFVPAKGFSKDDYIVKPTLRSVRGVPQMIAVPELKPALPSAYDKDYRGLSRVMQGLELNVKQLVENPKFNKEMSPLNIKAMRSGTLLGNIGQIMIKLDPKSKEFGTFKAETDKLFQQFRKETTGAQAALAELGWLAPDFPETTDNPDLYKEKAAVAIKRMQEAKDLLNKHWGQSYRIPSIGNDNKENNAVPGAVPSVGSEFNGEKVLRVRKI